MGILERGESRAAAKARWARQGGTSLIYQPGGVADDNIYTDTTSLRAALNASKGPRTLWLDNTFGDITLDAGIYGDKDVTVAGIRPGNSYVLINIDEGASIPANSWKDLYINWNGDTPVTTLADGDILIFDFASVDGKGNGPFIALSGADDSGAYISFYNSASFYSRTGSGGPVVDIPTDNYLILTMYDRSQILENTFTGDGSVTVTYHSEGASVSTIHADFNGSVDALNTAFSAFGITPQDPPPGSRYYWMPGGATLSLPSVSILAPGTQICIAQSSAGTLTISPDGSDTINGSTSDITTTGIYQSVTLLVVAEFFGANEWVLLNRT